jgi:hypothetical protein
MRKKKHRLPGITSTQVVQASVRRFSAQRKYLSILKERHRLDFEFKIFIEMLREKRSKTDDPLPDGRPHPFVLYMYSRQKGTKDLRRICIDDKTHSMLTWNVNSFTKKSLEMRKIYAVEKGSSGAFYSAIPNNKSLCFHVLAVGDLKLDFEVQDRDGAAQLYTFVINNFKRLVALYNGPCSFYLDIEGIPRRSGPSVVEYAISTKPQDGFRSEADENRYRVALGAIRAEYSDWKVQFENEKAAFKLKRLQKEGGTGDREDVKKGSGGGGGGDDDDADAQEDFLDRDEEAADEYSLATLSLKKGVKNIIVNTGIVGKSYFEKEEGDISPSLKQRSSLFGTQADFSADPLNSFLSIFRPGIQSNAAAKSSEGQPPESQFSEGRPPQNPSFLSFFNSEKVDTTEKSSGGQVPEGQPQNPSFWSFFSSEANDQDKSSVISAPLSVIEIDIDGKTFYVTNAVDGDIYLKDESVDEVGEAIGKMVAGKANFFDPPLHDPTANTISSAPAIDHSNIWGGVVGLFSGLGGASGNIEETKAEAPPPEAAPEETALPNLIEMEYVGKKYFIVDEMNSPIFSIDSNGIVDKEVGELINGVATFKNDPNDRKKASNKKKWAWLFGGGKAKPGQVK